MGKGEGKGRGGGCPIEHVVVVMLENRSFDHMLGFMKQLNPEIDGLSGDESNPVDPSDPSKGTVTVSDDSPYITTPDPGHSVGATTTEVFGASDPTSQDPPPMDGFVTAFANGAGAGERGGDIMKCFAPDRVPALSTLASEFAVFDQWFASIPGPTQPNRMYVHSATSDGAATNDVPHIIAGYAQNTIYNNIAEAGYSFGVYYSDFPATLIMRQLRRPEYLKSVHQIDKFYDDCANGTLPTYSFLEPRWFKFLDWHASDQHPPHEVQLGEFFIGDVYEAMRNSPLWEKSALIITYDEHGGFFDHVPTPLDGVPNPDGKVSTDPAFDFTRIGVRIPTVLVSPWVPKGTVVHQAPDDEKPQSTSQYEHSSILATMKELLNLPEFLTKRDEWASTFLDVLCGTSRDPKTHEFRYELGGPRRDCPLRLPRPGSKEMQERYKAAQKVPINEETIRMGEERHAQSLDPISDLQREVLIIANGCCGGKYDVDQIKTEHEGALFVRERIRELMSQVE